MKNKREKLLLSTTFGTAILSKVSKVFAVFAVPVAPRPEPAYGIEPPVQIKTPIYETILLVIGKILYYVLVPILLIIGCFKYVKNTKESKIAKVITCTLSVVLCGLFIFLQVKISEMISEEGYSFDYQILYIAITVWYIIGSIVYLIKKGIEEFKNVIMIPIAILIIMIGIKYLKIYMLPILILIAIIIMAIIVYLNRNKK